VAQRCQRCQPDRAAPQNGLHALADRVNHGPVAKCTAWRRAVPVGPPYRVGPLGELEPPAVIKIASQAARWTPSSGGTSRPCSRSSLGTADAAAVELTGRRAEYLAGPGAAWQALPRLPQGRAVTLALPASGGVDALAADGSVLTAWRLHATGSALSPGRWAQTQTTKVPIQYGSSS
jgi:hypothetical protein